MKEIVREALALLLVQSEMLECELIKARLRVADADHSLFEQGPKQVNDSNDNDSQPVNRAVPAEQRKLNFLEYEIPQIS
jgi:hypothetical protein